MRRLYPVLFVLVLTAPAQGEEVRMTLRQCLERALNASLEIREGRHLPRIAATGIPEAAAEFDHLFSFRTSTGAEKVRTGSAFESESGQREEIYEAELGLSRKLSTGGIYTFGARTRRFETDLPFFSPATGQLSFRRSTLWTSGLTLGVTQPILREAGPSYNLARTRLAETDWRRAGQEYRAVVHSTLAAVERAYWRLVFLRENLLVKRHSLKVAEELQRVSRRRLEAGAGTRIEVVQAEAGVADREKEMILAEARVGNAEDLLRSFVYPFTDDPRRETTIVPTDEVGPPPKSETSGTAERIRLAFDTRPDVLSAKEGLEAAGIRVVQTENDLLPRLDVFGNFGYTGLDGTFADSAGELRTFDFPAWEVGIVLEIPWGNRG
ncbi:MAG: TolC family protein, partial [Planctomycetota bacterium]